MQTIKSYIIEKLHINKDIQLSSFLNVEKLLSMNNISSNCRQAIKDCGDWLSGILNNLDDKYLDKIKKLHAESIFDFDDYIKDIKGISLTDYQTGNDTLEYSVLSIDDDHTIKQLEDKIMKAREFQTIYDIFWNTLLDYLSGHRWGNGNINNFTLSEFRGIDHALNLIFKEIINK